MLFFNAYAKTDYFNSLYYTPYDAKKINLLLEKYQEDPILEYLDKVLHVASVTQSIDLKQKIINVLSSKNELSKLLNRNSYRNFLILENLNLLKQKELYLFKKNIQKYRDEDTFYQRIFEIKNKNVNVKELFKSVTNVDSVVNGAIINAQNNISNDRINYWFKRNGGSEGLLNLFIYSYAYNSKYDELKMIFKQLSENPYLWEFLEMLHGKEEFNNDFYEHLYELDKNTYALGYIENLNNLSEKHYFKQEFIDSYYFSLLSFKALINYHKEFGFPSNKFDLFLKIKSNFKESLGKVLSHFQSNGDKKTYNKIIKESIPLTTFNLI